MISAGEIWDELATASDRKAQQDGWYLRRIYPHSNSDIFVALRQPGAVPALLVEVDASAVGMVGEYPSARGFELHPEPVIPGPRGRTRLCLVLADTRYRDVFEVLVNDVSERIALTPGEDEAVKTFIARLHVWQKFMRKHGFEGLTKEERIGLFGELLFLGTYLVDRVPAHDAVNAWKGPTRGNQDFDIGGRCVEVKSTTVIPPVTVNIASMTQLDETLVELLLLCHVSLVLDDREGESLPELVSRLRSTIQIQDVSALDGFNAKLIEAGYLDSHSELYSDTRYRYRETRFFKVTDDFPRIAVRDLRGGISECSYTVLLTACAPYEVGGIEAIAAVLNKKERSEIGT